LVCDGKTLRASITATDGGGGAFIAQVTLYFKAIVAAIAQATINTRENHQRTFLPELRSTKGSGRHLDPSRRFPHAETACLQLTEQGSDFLLRVQGKQRSLHHQISEQFLYSRRIPFPATVSEHGHGRETTWTLRAKIAADFITGAWPGST
jgi:hypothetical protein